MDSIDYYRGRAEAAKEVHELLQLIYTKDMATLEQLEILSKYLLGMAERANQYVDVKLNMMEAEHGRTL